MRRTSGRAAVIGLAITVAVGGTLSGAFEGQHRVARAAEASMVDLSIPADADISTDGTRVVMDEPPALPESIEVDDLIDAADAAIEALPAQAWEVEALAASLGNGPDTAFELVRDSIGFDAYPGVLRGADGTLAARAGNAWDRALLLRSLLDARGQTSRLAVGELPAGVADQLLARTFLEPGAPLPAMTGPAMGAGLAEAVAARARRDHAMLREALRGPGLPTGGSGSEVALQDLVSHAWVQVQRDGEWVDLDPSLPGARPGDTLTVPTATHDTVPDDAGQAVTLRLIAETLTDGVLSETLVLERRLDPPSVSDEHVLLYFAPEGGAGGDGLLGGGGGGLLGGGAPDAFVPVLSIDGEAEVGAAFVISGTVSGGLLGGSSDVDLVRLSLAVSLEAPGSHPITGRRVLLDRLPAGDPEVAGLDRAALATVAGGEEWPSHLKGVHHIMVSNGGTSPRATAFLRGMAAYHAALDALDPAALETSSVESAYWPIAVTDRELVVASELDVVRGVDDAEVRAFVARPRVFLASVGVDPETEGALMTTTDLLIDGIRVLPTDRAAPDTVARHQLWYGVLQAAVETELALRSAAALDPASRRLSGVSLEMTDPLRVLTGADVHDLPDTAPPRLREALAEDRIVVLSTEPGSASAWWEVGADGATRSVLAPSLGGVGKVGGRPPRLPPVGPADKLPSQPPPPQQPAQPPAQPQQPAKKPSRVPPRPEPGPARCRGGTEYTLLQRCVAIVVGMTIAQRVGVAIVGTIAIGVIALLIGVLVGA